MRAFSSMTTAVPLTPTLTARLDLFNVFDWDAATEVDEVADEESGVASPNASTSAMSLSEAMTGEASLSQPLTAARATVRRRGSLRVTAQPARAIRSIGVLGVRSASWVYDSL